MSAAVSRPPVTALHLEHARALYLSERSRREGIRGSLSTPLAAISFAVFALSSLAIQVDAERWRQAVTLKIMGLGVAAVARHSEPSGNGRPAEPYSVHPQEARHE